MLRLLRDANAATLDAPGGHVSGHVDVSTRGHSVLSRMAPYPRQLGRALQVSDMQEEHDAVERVLAALTDAAMDGITFKAEISARGHATVRLFTAPSGIGLGDYPGVLVRYEGALPEPARRLPEPNPGARPHPSADPVLLQRLLRQRLPGAAGATEEQLAAAEARLGMPLPDELKSLYRTVRAPGEWRDDSEDRDEGGEPGERDAADAMPVELFFSLDSLDSMLGELFFSLDDVHTGDATTRFPSWHLAREAVITHPGAAVQQLAGSPGWIVFGHDGAGGRFAIDMTPGPKGNLGQIIAIPRGEEIGAFLQARSLTDFVRGRFAEAEDFPRPGEGPVIAKVYQGGQQAIEAIARPDLEVLVIVKGQQWEGEPLDLTPLARLPKLRTLCADPGTLAHPLQIADIAALEYLELGPLDWRTLLDANAVPDSLLAAEITVRGNPVPQPQPDPARYIALANEIIALWKGPQIEETVIDGQLE
jgi:cell wall assembly regulator SMI1